MGAAARYEFLWFRQSLEEKCNSWHVLRLFIAEGSKDVDVVFYNGAKKFKRLFQRSLQALQNLRVQLASLSLHLSKQRRGCRTCLQLNLCLGDILLASTAACNLLGLGDLSTDSLGAEVLERVSLDGVDAQGGVGLDNGESTGNCENKDV